MQTPPLERLADSLPIHRDAVRIFWAICTSLLSAGSRRFRRQESKCEDHVPESLGGFTKFAPGLKCPALVRNAIRTCGFVLGMAFFASCYAQSPIVGKWQEVAPKTETLEFFKDGTVSVVNPAESISAAGKYSFIDKDRIKMELGGAIGELIGPQIMRVAVSGDEMKLIGLDGEVSVYNRAGSAKAIAQPDVTTMVFTNFISAVQRGDTPAAIQLTHSHMTAVKQLQDNNPKVLWDKLTAKLLQDEVQWLGSQDFWQQYAQGLSGNSAAYVVKTAYTFLPKSAKWRITEIKRDKVDDVLGIGPYARTVAYITVDYPEEGGPVANNQLLRKAIIVLAAHGATTGIVSLQRIGDADEFWPIPPITEEFASNATRRSNWRVDYIKPPETPDKWLIVGLPSFAGRGSAELELYFRTNGFELRGWKIQGGWGANQGHVRPPETWHKYEAHIGNNVGYSLCETNEVSLSGLTVKGDTATAVASVKRSGGGPVYQFVQRYYKLAAAKEIAQGTAAHGNMFFRVYYPGNESGSFDASFPGSQDWEVVFKCSATEKPRPCWVQKGIRLIEGSAKNWVGR